MLYRDIARLGVLSFKLHVNAIQSPVHYYQILKRNFIVATGIEPMTYDRSEPQYFSFSSMIYSTYVSHLNLVQMFHVLCY